MRDAQLKLSPKLNLRPTAQHPEVSDSPTVNARPALQIRLHSSPLIPAQSDIDPPSPQKLPHWQRRSPQLDSLSRPSSYSRQKRPKADIAASFTFTDWTANAQHPQAEAFPQPMYQDHPDVGPAFAIPYVFETVPLSPPSQNLAPRYTGLSSPTELADPDSLAAMWCLLEEESRGSHSLRENNHEAGPSTRGEEPAIWLEDCENVVERWPHTGMLGIEYTSFPPIDIGA